MTVLFAPHADDETLFAAFTVIKYQPKIVVCFGSERDYGDTHVRMQESRAAARVLTGAEQDVVQWHAEDADMDLERTMRAFDEASRPQRVWAPDVNTSHPQHRIVALAAYHVFKGRLTTYHTYSNGEKVRSGRPVRFDPGWVARKLRALACYDTQIQHPRANQFFLQDLREYYGEDL